MQRNVDALRDETFDVVILGGGITGAGVALDATLRGYRVALLDKGDFSSGTSSVSSKLVHGGIRYLEQGQFKLVFEALRERQRLLRNAPNLVWPLTFVIPFFPQSRMPSWKWHVGLLLYDCLAGRSNLGKSTLRSSRWIRLNVPNLRSALPISGATYLDAQMDDARLAIEILLNASSHGAIACNYVEAIQIDHSSVRARDSLTGRELDVRAKVILNATGPWSDLVRRLTGHPTSPSLAPTKGVHLILPDLGHAYASLLLHPRDGRVFFVIPWLGKTLLGTTDTDCDSSPDDLSVTENDVAYLLEGYNEYFELSVDRSGVLNTQVGLRPLAALEPGTPSSRSREWRIEEHENVLSVIGGKYTTFRQMAEEICDRITLKLGHRRRCRTRTFRLQSTPSGSWQEYQRRATNRLNDALQLPSEVSEHLVRRYGSKVGEVARLIAKDPTLANRVIEGEPDVYAEFVYQRENEMALSPSDFLLRRTRLGLFHPELLRSTPDRLRLLTAGQFSLTS